MTELCAGCSWFRDKSWSPLSHRCEDDCPCDMTDYCHRGEKRDYHFWTNEWAQWPIRGKERFIANIKAQDCPEDLWDMSALHYHNVYINGSLRRTHGIETFRHYISPTSPYRKSFCIALEAW